MKLREARDTWTGQSGERIVSDSWKFAGAVDGKTNIWLANRAGPATRIRGAMKLKRGRLCTVFSGILAPRISVSTRLAPGPRFRELCVAADRPRCNLPDKSHRPQSEIDSRRSALSSRYLFRRLRSTFVPPVARERCCVLWRWVSVVGREFDFFVSLVVWRGLWWVEELGCCLFGEFCIWGVLYLGSFVFGEFCIWGVLCLRSFVFEEFCV